MYGEDEDVFLIMEHCEEDNRQDIWPQLRDSDKNTITKQLRTILDQLRQEDRQNRQNHRSMVAWTLASPILFMDQQG